MKKILFFILLLIVSGNFVKAQNLIAVQHGNNASFYTNLDSAVTYAQNGDYIYLSGGAFAVSDNYLIINKELHIIGVGHNPDSTIATGMTKINATIYFVSGANNSSLEGLYLNGGNIKSLSHTGIQQDVDNISIKRCHINGSITLSWLSTNWVVTENFIDAEVWGAYNTSSYAQGNYFSNNIFGSTVNYFGPNNHFKNNIILYPSGSFVGITSCVFENNICFVNPSGIISCTFNNNYFINLYNFPVDCIGINNFGGTVWLYNIFVNYGGNASLYYNYDYHLISSFPGKNAGTDGTDIGIYGGMFPWKDGSLPPNPHIQQKIIQQSTNANGSLPVNIKVAAQEH